MLGRFFSPLRGCLRNGMGVLCRSTPFFTRPLSSSYSFSAVGRLLWNKKPERVLIIKKPKEPAITEAMGDMIKMLNDAFQIQVYVERKDLEDFPETQPFSQEHVPIIDFIICLGGDGTVLYTSKLFPLTIPPVVAFSMGTLGFLIHHSISDSYGVLRALVENKCTVTPRMRLVTNFITKRDHPPTSIQVVNDVALHRAAWPHMAKLECYLDHKLLTTSKTDGLLVATPTGSTAYSLSAGGSMVHPSVNCILLTPICPQSLSFRPLILPPDAELTLKVTPDSRAQVIAAFDGLQGLQLGPSEAIKVHKSIHWMYTINKVSTSADWVVDMNEQLKFNQKFEKPAETRE